MTTDRFKFRAYDTLKKEWCYGYEQVGGFALVGECVFMGEISKYPLEYYQHIQIMQWTGFKIGGKDVYEYDILLNRDGARLNYAVVVWISEWAMFAVLNPDEWEGYREIGWLALDENEPYNTWTEDLGAYELAGNIFEHSNLMEL